MIILEHKKKFKKNSQKRMWRAKWVKSRIRCNFGLNPFTSRRKLFYTERSHRVKNEWRARSLLVQINIMKWFVALDNIPVSVNCFCLITDRIDHILIHPKRNIHQFRSPFFNLRRRLNWPNARVSRFNLFWCQCWFNNFFNFFWCQFGRRPSPSCSVWRWFRADWCWQSGTGR